MFEMKIRIPVQKHIIKENLQRFRKGEPLTLPLKTLGVAFKQEIYHKFPTPEVRKKRLEANKKYIDRWMRERKKKNG